MNNNDDIQYGLVKIGSAWFAAILAKVGITSWGDAASLLAFIYTLLLLCEWWWKRFWRPLLERNGILQRRARRKDDFR